MSRRIFCALALSAACWMFPRSVSADPDRDRMAEPVASTQTQDANGAWAALLPLAGHYMHTAVYDPVRDRMIVFAGFASVYNQPGADCNQAWALSLSGTPTWSLIPVGAPLPSSRHEPVAIYDPAGDRMIVFGGSDGANLGDLWALSLAGDPEWTQLAPAGPAPAPSTHGAAIYDPVRSRMIVFRGDTSGNELWALSLPGTLAWTQLSVPGAWPSARWGAQAVYDPVRDRMLLYGGADAHTSLTDVNSYPPDVWALSLSGTLAWNQIANSYETPGRTYHSLVYDAVNDRMVTYGGNVPLAGDDTWALNLSGTPTWVRIAQAGTQPSPRHGHTAIADPVRQRMLVFAGTGSSGIFSDAWSLPFVPAPTWSAVATSNGVLARERHTATYDPVRKRMLVFGGFDGTFHNDLWSLPIPASQSWTALAPAGPLPSARERHTTIYDPAGDRLIVFGGRAAPGVFVNDVWQLSLAGAPTWSALSPAGTPPSARHGHSAIYDPVRSRMIVFGGFDGAEQNDVWTLNLTGSPAWTLLSPSGTPPTGRERHSAIYDPVSDRMLVFGGSDGALKNDVWALSLGNAPEWSLITPAGTPPSARYRHTALYDPVRVRMVVFGGNAASGACADAWGLTLAGAPSWSAIGPAGQPPASRYFHTAIYDPQSDAMIVHGGNGPQSDVWSLAWSTPVAVEPQRIVPAISSIARVFPNPARGAVMFEVQLSEPAGRRTLAVFDLRGRRVWQQSLGSFGTGIHRVPWDGRTREGARPPGGVYFARIEGAPAGAGQRFVLLQ
jgi:hypothetical protein